MHPVQTHMFVVVNDFKIGRYTLGNVTDVE